MPFNFDPATSQPRSSIRVGRDDDKPNRVGRDDSKPNGGGGIIMVAGLAVVVGGIIYAVMHKKPGRGRAR